MNSANRLIENGTILGFYPYVLDQYLAFTNNVYDPIGDVQPGWFDDIPQLAQDIIFDAIDAAPAFSTQDAMDAFDDMDGFVFGYLDFAAIEAFIQPYVNAELDPEMHFKAYVLFYCTIHGKF